MKKKILSFIMFSLMFVSAGVQSVFAVEQEILETYNDELTAYKETVKIKDKVGEYDVQISVPGKEGVEQHDEVILMVDGSYSMDNEWPQMKSAIIEIGKAFLNGTGNTQLTLMAFGMGDNEVLTHVKTVQELEKSLGELPGTLLYGRSSTNCEAGFTGVIEYIQNHDETLNDVHVVFISDGNINTDETPYTFYNWKENTWLRYSVEDIIVWNFENECQYIIYGGNPSNAFKTIFGEDADVNEVMESATLEQKIAWADLAWANVYEEAGMDKDTAYPVSVAERAFVSYDENNGTYVQDLFYYALVGRSYPNRWNRTSIAADALAEMEEVVSLYVIDYDGYSSWMDTGITSSKSQFIQSEGIAGLIEALEDVITDLSETSYNNSVITDYTSKWVNPMDINGDGIFDEKDITVIYNGEVLETAKISVINLTNITEEELENLSLEEQEEIRDILANDPLLNGNSNGYVYRIKWYIKEGMLKASDRYILSYKVEVDTEEDGYISGNSDYKANGEVNLTYDKTENSEEDVETVTKSGIVIKEDPIIQEENVITITKTDEEGNLLSGADFEVSSIETNVKDVIKEYSINGTEWYVWDTLNPNYNAIYFRFSNLYDYKYTLSEIKIPKWYIGMEDKVYDFTNLEGKLVEETIINTSIKGEIIIHYVVKVGDEYVPFEEFAYNEEGNLISIFEGINIEDVILSGKAGEKFETYYEIIDGLTLNGLYVGNLFIDNTVLNKLVNDKFIGTFNESTQEFTYVFEVNVGNGEEEYPMPPQTGYDLNFDYLYLMLTCVFLMIKKVLI